jgi:hypothetical protein
MSPPGPWLVKWTEHVDIPAVPATRAHVDESKAPVPCVAGPSDQVTVPSGLVAPVVLVSVTVAVHREGWPATTVWSQTMDVLVGARFPTDTVAVLELIA